MRHFSGINNKWIKQKEGSPAHVLTSTVDCPLITGTTFPEFVFQNLHKWENAPAIKCAITGRQYTHGQVYKNSRGFAAALKHAGFKRNDGVCILLPNVPEFPSAALGSMQAGCFVSLINPVYTKDEIAKQINDCGGKVVVTLPQFVPLVEAARGLCRTLSEKTIVISDESVANCHSYYEMVKTDTTGVEFLKGSDLNATTGETCLLPYSSGTTGVPKGVEITHSALSTNLKSVTSPGYFHIYPFEGGTPQDRFLALLPFFHIYGFQVIMSVGLYQGCFVNCLPKFETNLCIKALTEHKPTILHLVTPLINFLASHPDVSPSVLSETKGIIVGAAPLGKELITKFLDKFGKQILFQEGYGMSETLITHIVPKDYANTKLGSVGAMLPGITCKIIDAESGKPVAPNQSGELYIQGQIMKGYWRNDKATQTTIDKDKFVITGDIAHFDDDGFLYIEERLKDLIKVKGLQVAPSEVEDVLRQHPDIADVAVVGVQHERMGEAPRAYIVKKNDKLSAEDVNAFLKPKLAAHKQLAGGIEFITTIPRAASGKILKKDLLADYNAKMKK